MEKEVMEIFRGVGIIKEAANNLQMSQFLSDCPNQPLKELVKLRERNKDLELKIEEMHKAADEQQKVIQHLLQSTPEPCTKFKDASLKEWVAKLNEEVAEVVEAAYKYAYKPDCNDTELLREMIDVSTVIRSAEYAAGYSDKEIADMQKWVNKHNRERGYME